MYRYDIRDVDGISHLDMGEAYLRGDWSTALNAYWSPFYGWLLGVAVGIVQPSPLWEYPLTQVVNFSIYVAAFASFDLLLRQLARADGHAGSGDAGRRAALPEWALLAIGYSVFVWSALYWHYFWLQSPDLLLAVWIFLAASLLLQVRARARLQGFLLLGLVLGLGYLTKAAMFPLAFVFMAIAAAATRDLRAAARGGVVALASFLLVASPLIVALSVHKGRFTFGDAGRLNYAWFVNDDRTSPDWQYHPHWRGGSRFGQPLHSPHQIFSDPLALEFASPVGGTYPPWYDPSHWHEGLQLRFELDRQLHRLGKSAKFLFDFFGWGPQPGLFAALVVLLLVAGGGRVLPRDVARHWDLIVPSLFAIAMYAFVRFEGRYIAPFVVLLWLAFFAGARSREDDSPRRAGTAAAIAVTSLVLVLAAVATLGDLARDGEPSHDARRHAELAHALWAVGVQPGDEVAVVGSWLDAARWARLARVRIVAEVPWAETEAF